MVMLFAKVTPFVRATHWPPLHVIVPVPRALDWLQTMVPLLQVVPPL
jgi:hypothetical protein